MERISYSLRCASVVNLLIKLQERGSWCGETHVQKAMYISQDLSKANLGYKFIMYKHGPFSFELKDELAAMRATGIIEYAFPQRDYGPSIKVTSFGMRIFDVHRDNIVIQDRTNEFVAKWLATSDVRNLEKLATAYYVTQKNPRDPIIVRAKKINSLKPHVDVVAAEEAIKIVEQKRQQAINEIMMTL
jgi:uncharacterized protein YwgA